MKNDHLKANGQQKFRAIIYGYAGIFYALVVLFEYLYPYPYASTLSRNLLTVLGDLLAIYFVLSLYQKNKNFIAIIFFLGICCNFLGDSIWLLYEVVLNRSVPRVSICESKKRYADKLYAE